MKTLSPQGKHNKSASLEEREISLRNGSRRVSVGNLFKGPTGFVFFTIFLTAVFVKPLLSLVFHVIGSDLHSYILLVPLISAYLLYIRRKELPKNYLPSFKWGLFSLVVGFVALATALMGRATSSLTRNDDLALIAFSFVCFLTAGGFLFLGRKWMAAAAFPLAFLFFLVPLPDAAADFLRIASKAASAETASLFFNLTGTPVFRDGTVFQLPNIVIEVAEECSGIRSSWVLLITSLLAANLFLKSPWRRILLIAVVIPLGILRNGFRILVIGLLCTHVSPQMIHSVIHHRGGPLFFTLSLVPLFLLIWWLRRNETSSGWLKRAGPQRMKAEKSKRTR